MRYTLTTPDGDEIKGTLEVLPGCARADSIDDEGEPEYEGDTEVFWNDQRPDVDPGSKERLWLDYAHNVWRESELVRTPIADDEEG